MSAPKTTPVLHIDGIDAGYGETSILRDISIRVDPGETYRQVTRWRFAQT